MNIGGVSFHRPRPASRLIHAKGYAASLMPLCPTSRRCSYRTASGTPWAPAEADQLGGTVEVDETYVGGKPPKGAGSSKRGRGTSK